MPNNFTTTHKIEKGDVLWVPYRKDPLWPALVQNVYPKKITYNFFPLPSEKEMRANRFSCSPKLTYALIPTEQLPAEADAKLVTAFRAASSYLNSMGRARGAVIESIEEAEEREGNEEDKRRIGTKRRRVHEQTDGFFDLRAVKEEILDEEEEPALKKTASSSTTDPPSRSESPAITEKESKEMMRLIDKRLKLTFDNIWNSEAVRECKEETMKEEMTIHLRNYQFLTESDYETLFERVILLIRAQSASPSLLLAVKIAASVILPEILINCYSEWKMVDLETATQDFYQQNSRVLGLDPTMSIPVTDHLEQLCRLACNESEAIEK